MVSSKQVPPDWKVICARELASLWRAPARLLSFNATCGALCKFGYCLFKCSFYIVIGQL